MGRDRPFPVRARRQRVPNERPWSSPARRGPADGFYDVCRPSVSRGSRQPTPRGGKHRKRDVLVVRPRRDCAGIQWTAKPRFPSVPAARPTCRRNPASSGSRLERKRGRGRSGWVGRIHPADEHRGDLPSPTPAARRRDPTQADVCGAPHSHLSWRGVPAHGGVSTGASRFHRRRPHLGTPPPASRHHSGQPHRVRAAGLPAGGGRHHVRPVPLFRRGDHLEPRPQRLAGT